MEKLVHQEKRTSKGERGDEPGRTSLTRSRTSPAPTGTPTIRDHRPTIGSPSHTCPRRPQRNAVKTLPAFESDRHQRAASERQRAGAVTASVRKLSAAHPHNRVVAPPTTVAPAGKPRCRPRRQLWRLPAR